MRPVFCQTERYFKMMGDFVTSAVNSKAGVAAVDRAFTILGAFTHDRPVQSLAEIARNTGLYKSTILRLMGSLEAYGYVHQRADGAYQLGPKLAELSSIFQDAFDLRDYVQPILKEIVDQTHEGVSFLIRDGDWQLCLFRQDGRHAVRDYHIRVGTRMPLDRGASARLFRRFEGTYAPAPGRYYSLSHGEVNDEMAAIASPVFGAQKPLVGALLISSPISRFTSDHIALLKAVSTSASAKLSISLGCAPGRFEGEALQITD